MKKLAIGFVVLLTLAGIIGTMTPAMGQEVTASIVGTVTDPSGAPIKGANVKATDTERGTVWTAETNDTGSYNFLRFRSALIGVKVTRRAFRPLNCRRSCWL